MACTSMPLDARLELGHWDGLWIGRPGIASAFEPSQRAGPDECGCGRQLLLLQRLQQAAAAARGQREELGGALHAGLCRGEAKGSSAIST